MTKFMGPEVVRKTAIYGPRNGKNGATNILAPETDQMVEQNYIGSSWVEAMGAFTEVTNEAIGLETVL